MGKEREQSVQNSLVTLAMPAIDNDSAARQSASELVLEVDESGSQPFRPRAVNPANKQMLGSFNFGHHAPALQSPVARQAHGRKQACLSQLHSQVEQDLKSNLLINEDSNALIQVNDHQPDPQQVAEPAQGTAASNPLNTPLHAAPEQPPDFHLQSNDTGEERVGSVYTGTVGSLHQEEGQRGEPVNVFGGPLPGRVPVSINKSQNMELNRTGGLACPSAFKETGHFAGGPPAPREVVHAATQRSQASLGSSATVESEMQPH